MAFYFNKNYKLSKTGDTYDINDYNIQLLNELLNIDPDHQGIFFPKKNSMVYILENEFKPNLKNFSIFGKVFTLFSKINSENSTRLSKDEIEAYAIYFSKNFKQIENDIKNNDSRIVKTILSNTQNRNKIGNQIKLRYNLSFISKVISFIWYYCYYNPKKSGSAGFSIYDKVVKENLGKYILKSIKNYKTNSNNYKIILNSQTRDIDYKNYNDIIKDIIEDLNNNLSQKNKLNRREFDFFIYFLYR